MTFDSNGEDGKVGKARSGVCGFPDALLLSAIDRIRADGITSQSGISEELTDRFGGIFLGGAFRGHELTRESDVLAAQMSQRLRDLDIPRKSPLPHSNPTTPEVKVKLEPSSTSAPTTHRAKEFSFDEPVVQGYVPPRKTTQVNPPHAPILANGTILPDNQPSVQVTGPGTFATTNPLPPIPGVCSAPGGPLSDSAFLTSMVYHMDRIANPDINANPCTLDGIRRNDEIHVYLARFFDNNTVALFPGVVGKQ